MTEVLSRTPARLFGLEGKGRIEAGADADLVLWDPSAIREIRQADLHHTSDFTPYEGLEVQGAAKHVLLRGRAVEAGSGRFIERRLA
jgi:dihydropyrimidinase